MINILFTFELFFNRVEYLFIYYWPFNFVGNNFIFVIFLAYFCIALNIHDIYCRYTLCYLSLQNFIGSVFCVLTLPY